MQPIMPQTLTDEAGAHGPCIKLLTDKHPGQENTDVQTAEDGTVPPGKTRWNSTAHAQRPESGHGMGHTEPRSGPQPARPPAGRRAGARPGPRLP